MFMLASDKCLKTCAKKTHTGTGMSKPSTRPARPLPSLAMICDARIEQFRPIRKTKEAGITARCKAPQTKETTTPNHTSITNIIITATAAPTTCKEPQKTIGSTISKIIVTTKKEGLGLETQRVGWE